MSVLSQAFTVSGPLRKRRKHFFTRPIITGAPASRSFFSLVAKICIFFPDVPSSKTQKTGDENHELPPLGLPLSQIMLLSHAQTSGWRYKSRNICLELSTQFKLASVPAVDVEMFHRSRGAIKHFCPCISLGLFSSSIFRL